MKVRIFKEEDHEMISKWWKAYGWPVLPLHALPATGIIAYNDKEDLCAGFIYKTDSTFCILEWIVGNPDASKENRSEGIDMVLETFVYLAKQDGFKLIFSNIKHPNLKKKYEEQGFIQTDEGMTNFVRSL